MPREVHPRMQYSTDDDVIIAQAEEDDVRADVVFQKAWSDAAHISRHVRIDGDQFKGGINSPDICL